MTQASMQTRPSARQRETLGESVYLPSLSEGNRALNGTNPLLAIPAALATYSAVAALIFFVATKTDVGKKVIVGTGPVDVFLEPDVDEMEEPPPPPPRPFAHPLVKPAFDQGDPPPPPPSGETVPELAPDTLPTIDQSTRFVNSGADGGGPIGVGDRTPGSWHGDPIFATKSVTAEIPSTEVVVTKQPSRPPYPAIVAKARIQGLVVVEITIGADGVPVSAKALSGPAQLHDFAVDWARQWRFRPYSVDGAPQQAKFVLRMDFRL